MSRYKVTRRVFLGLPVTLFPLHNILLFLFYRKQKHQALVGHFVPWRTQGNLFTAHLIFILFQAYMQEGGLRAILA